MLYKPRNFRTKFVHLDLGNQEVLLDNDNANIEMIRDSGESSSEDELSVSWIESYFINLYFIC